MQNVSGMALCRGYYEAFGAPMLKEKFGNYVNQIAVGHVGEGSECFGFDDAVSTDHDFGPGFSLWVTRELYSEIGEALQKAYAALPDTFMGYARVASGEAAGRFGVCEIETFYTRALGGNPIPTQVTDFLMIEDCYLACATNGEVYRDDAGQFLTIRNALKAGYHPCVRYMKMAQAAGEFGQNGQYNFGRMAKREDWTAVLLAKANAVRQAMRLAYLLAETYAPHEKWLHRGLRELQPEVYSLVKQITAPKAVAESEMAKDVAETSVLFEQLAAELLRQLKAQGLVTTNETFFSEVAKELAERGRAAFRDLQESQKI